MKRNEQNYPQGTGYPQQNGYAPGNYSGSMPYQGYQLPQGYNQGQNSTPRNYQTPQVTGSQPAAGSQPASSAYTGQGAFSQGGYQQQGYAPSQNGYSAASYPQTAGYPQQNGYQQPAGYPQPNGYQQQTGYQQAAGYPQTNGYTQQNGYQQAAGYPQQNGYQQSGGNSGASGFTYPGNQVPGASYIPQTPYSQGYTSPGYQTGGYAQGYNAYNQMGRSSQMTGNTRPDMSGQVPLNGGGYVPQPVPVRKRPFVLTDAYLLIVSALMLGLFIIGIVPSFGLGAVKFVFLVLAAVTIALLWIKPMTDSNKRLCYTAVFGLLAFVTAISLVLSQPGDNTTDRQQNANRDPSAGTAVTVQADSGGDSLAVQSPAPTNAVTYTPAPNADNEVLERLRTFFYYWSLNQQDNMLTLCSPSWASKEDNPKTALFALLRNRTPKDFVEENISGTANDTSRTVTITSTMDRNNGKDPVKYRMNIMMDKEADGLWYVNPTSLLSYDDADTPDPSITETPAPTATPAVYSNTVLYYNPGKGEYYHLDQNCKRIAEKYLPLQGHFTYAEINDEKYKKLKPCAVCGAPYRE